MPTCTPARTPARTPTPEPQPGRGRSHRDSLEGLTARATARRSDAHNPANLHLQGLSQLLVPNPMAGTKRRAEEELEAPLPPWQRQNQPITATQATADSLQQLCCYAQRDDVGALTQLLPDVLQQLGSDDRARLGHAAAHGTGGMVLDVLLRQGVVPLETTLGQALLTVASLAGNLPAIEVLLRSGVRPERATAECAIEHALIQFMLTPAPARERFAQIVRRFQRWQDAP